MIFWGFKRKGALIGSCNWENSTEINIIHGFLRVKTVLPAGFFIGKIAIRQTGCQHTFIATSLGRVSSFLLGSVLHLQGRDLNDLPVIAHSKPITMAKMIWYKVEPILDWRPMLMITVCYWMSREGKERTCVGKRKIRAVWH